MSFSDKISWVGGMMGLFTGFSVISGIEILYWLWFKVVFHRKNEVSPLEISEEESDIGKLKEQITLLQNEIADIKLKYKNSHSEDPKAGVFFDAIFNDIESQQTQCGLKDMN